MRQIFFEAPHLSKHDTASATIADEVIRTNLSRLIRQSFIANSYEAYCLNWLLDEVSITIDATAAGGNARLMTIG